ncbi:glycosyltransferase family 2 protein [bacterium]|nr:glycosyltransferase family 2 protein [bacterium]
MKIVVVIPAYNEEKIIGQVVRAALKESSLVIVVDDGSTDRTGQIAQKAGAKVYRHIINLGLGSSLATGLMAARQHHPEIVITMDADGQHRAEDIPSLIKPLEDLRADFVVGSRFLGKSFRRRDESVPAIRWF